MNTRTEAPVVPVHVRVNAAKKAGAGRRKEGRERETEKERY